MTQFNLHKDTVVLDIDTEYPYAHENAEVILPNNFDENIKIRIPGGKKFSMNFHCPDIQAHFQTLMRNKNVNKIEEVLDLTIYPNDYKVDFKTKTTKEKKNEPK